jgi:hypothetical protein
MLSSRYHPLRESRNSPALWHQVKLSLLQHALKEARPEHASRVMLLAES